MEHPGLNLHGIQTIISGGQTGVDRAALDWALKNGITCAGWCPKGRRAEDGPISLKYPMKETLSETYAERTAWNVLTSDATLIISPIPLKKGSAYTRLVADSAGKPWMQVGPEPDIHEFEAFSSWVRRHKVKTLNVAGPRESSVSGIYELAVKKLCELFS
jgi:hypothetical protein